MGTIIYSMIKQVIIIVCLILEKQCVYLKLKQQQQISIPNSRDAKAPKIARKGATGIKSHNGKRTGDNPNNPYNLEENQLTAGFAANSILHGGDERTRRTEEPKAPSSRGEEH